MPNVKTDVVIVGAGPTGLMLANCLTKLGISTVIIDGKSEPTRESRALVLQARTMEIYDQLGVVDRVLTEAEKAGSIVPGFEKKSFGAVNLQHLATGVTHTPTSTCWSRARTNDCWSTTSTTLASMCCGTRPSTP